MTEAHSHDHRTAEQVVEHYWRHVWLERDFSVLGDSYTDPTVRHTVNGTRTVTVAELEKDLSESLRAYRGDDFSIDQLTVVDDIAWLRLTLRGVSLAAMTPLVITWLAQYRIADGLIAETWALHCNGLDWH